MEKRGGSRRIPEEKAASPVDIEAAIDGLTEVQLSRLEKFALFRVRGLGRKAVGRSARDLLQAALTATASRDRRWNPEAVDFVRHLEGAMRSISNHWKEQFDPAEPRLESEVIRRNSEGEKHNPMLEVPSAEVNAERALAARQEVDEIKKM